MAQRKKQPQPKRAPRRKKTSAFSLRSPFRRKAVEFKPDVIILGCTHYPIIKDTVKKCAEEIIGDVEIVFLHYKTEAEAKEKWERRKMRVNYDDIIYKFSRMNLCTEEHLKGFDSLPYENKFILNNRKHTRYKSEIFWKSSSNDSEIFSDTENFPGNLKIRKILKGNK